VNLLFFAFSLTPPRRPFSAGPILLQSPRRERMDEWTLLSFAPPASLRQLSDSSPPPVFARPRRASAGRGLFFSVPTFPCFCFILFSASRALLAAGLPCGSSFIADPAVAAASLFPRPPRDIGLHPNLSLFVEARSSRFSSISFTHSHTFQKNFNNRSFTHMRMRRAIET
jgi:hypothetical protein